MLHRLAYPGVKSNTPPAANAGAPFTLLLRFVSSACDGLRPLAVVAHGLAPAFLAEFDVLLIGRLGEPRPRVVEAGLYGAARATNWRITKGHKVQLFLFGLALIGLNILGLLALVVGIVVSVPATWLAVTHAYRKL
jgi:hypothetical protein